jgi:hypothetical protein
VKRWVLGSLIVLAVALVGCRFALPRKAAPAVDPTTPSTPVQPTSGTIVGTPTVAASETAGGTSVTAGSIPPRHLADLPIVFPIESVQSAAYFNQMARPTDVALVSERGAPRILPALTAGQRSVVWTSWADAERQFPTIPPGVTIIGYNPEHWNQTPPDEQQDLSSTVKRAAEFAHAHGLKLLVAPDLRFDQESLAQIAPYADTIVLQGQRLQADPAAFATSVKGLVRTAHVANPKILVYVQVGAPRGSAAQMIGALRGVEGDVDGIVVWTTLQTLTTLQDLVRQLRAGPS